MYLFLLCPSCCKNNLDVVFIIQRKTCEERAECVSRSTRCSIFATIASGVLWSWPRDLRIRHAKFIHLPRRYGLSNGSYSCARGFYAFILPSPRREINIGSAERSAAWSQATAFCASERCERVRFPSGRGGGLKRRWRAWKASGRRRSDHGVSNCYSFIILPSRGGFRHFPPSATWFAHYAVSITSHGTWFSSGAIAASSISDRRTRRDMYIYVYILCRFAR